MAYNGIEDDYAIKRVPAFQSLMLPENSCENANLNKV